MSETGIETERGMKVYLKLGGWNCTKSETERLRENPVATLLPKHFKCMSVTY